MVRPNNSVQLYSVRDLLASSQSETLDRLAALGFRSVEPFGLPGDYASLKTGLDSAGLTAPTAHASVLLDPKLALEAASVLGTEILIDPYQPESFFQSEGELKKLADQLSGAAETARDYGIVIGYHNHDHEVRNEIKGIPALVALAEQTSKDVVFEIDLFWLQVAGSNATDILRALENRVVALHIKDAPLGAGVENQVPAGTGDVPILECLSQVPDARAVLEFDEFSGDVIEAIGSGLKYLLENGVGE